MPENIRILTCDADGSHTGDIEKVAAHMLPGVLHRAFSAVLIDEMGRVVLQRRSSKKMMWPLFWSNSCCSHYHGGGGREWAQVEQRIIEELGCKAINLECVTQFQYRARYLEVGVEAEVCDIWLGTVHSHEICENSEEVDAVAFVHPADVSIAMRSQTSAFTPWFTLEWLLICDRLITRANGGAAA